MGKKEWVAESGDNVFSDMGFSAEESVTLKMCVELIAGLRATITAQGWMQAGIAPAVCGGGG
jgi:hypothetical protein